MGDSRTPGRCALSSNRCGRPRRGARRVRGRSYGHPILTALLDEGAELRCALGHPVGFGLLGHSEQSFVAVDAAVFVGKLDMFLVRGHFTNPSSLHIWYLQQYLHIFVTFL